MAAAGAACRFGYNQGQDSTSVDLGVLRWEGAVLRVESALKVDDGECDEA